MNKGFCFNNSVHSSSTDFNNTLVLGEQDIDLNDSTSNP